MIFINLFLGAQELDDIPRQFVKVFLHFYAIVLGNAGVHKQAAQEMVKIISETKFFKPEGMII